LFLGQRAQRRSESCPQQGCYSALVSVLFLHTACLALAEVLQVEQDPLAGVVQAEQDALAEALQVDHTLGCCKVSCDSHC